MFNIHGVACNGQHLLLLKGLFPIVRGMRKNDKIFIAGHRGLVGSSVVRLFPKKGYSNLLLKAREELDLIDQAAVNLFFETERPDYVVLAAAHVGGIMANMQYQADFLYNNLMIQNNVIWNAHRYGVKKLLFLGSSCIYPRDCLQPIKEDYLLSGKLEPTNEGYAVAKIAGIKLCEKIYEQYGKTFISCMPTNLYGIHDNFHPEHSHVIPGLIHKFCTAKAQKKPQISLWGTGSPKREFMYVDDLADAVYFLMENHDAKEFINIGTGEEVTIRELAQTIAELIDYKGTILFDSTHPDGTPQKLLDLTRLHSLGWKHSIPLREGLKRTIDYYINTISNV